MKTYKSIENGVEYDIIECIGPLEYVDAKCLVFKNTGRCIIIELTIPTTLSGGYTSIDCKEYYLNRELHRDNGPAIDYIKDPNRSKYYLKGKKMKPDIYKRKIKLEKIKKLNSYQEKL